MRIGLIDTVILLAYLAATAFIGFWVARKEKKTTQDYFLAGSVIPWYAVGLSILASSISTEQFIGEVGYAYSHGLAVANWEWLNFPALTILIWIFIPLYIRGRVMTMPEFLERRYGVASRTIFALLSIVSYAVVNLAMVLYGGALALNYVFGLPFYACAVGLAVVTGVYTVYGGLTSVVWTDVFQAVLLVAGGLLVFVLGVMHVDGGWAAIIGTGTRAHLVLPASDPDLPWTAMLALAFSTNIWYFCSNQYINQRCLAAKDEWHAKMGTILYGLMGVLLALCVTFPGLIAYAINPNLDDPNNAYAYLVTTLLPPSLRGIVLAALISAIMSTVSSLVNSTATIFTIDVYQRFSPREQSQEHLITVGRWAGAIALAVGLACVPVVSMWKNLFDYCQNMYVLMGAPTVAVFVVGVLWRRASKTAAAIVMFSAFPLFFVPYVQQIHPFLPATIANLYVFGLVALIGCFVAMIAISLVTEAPKAEKIEGLHWSFSMLRLPSDVAALRPHWFQSVGIWWFVMIGAFCIIYAWFW